MLIVTHEPSRLFGKFLVGNCLSVNIFESSKYFRESDLKLQELHIGNERQIIFTEVKNHHLMTSLFKEHWHDPRDSFYYTQVANVRKEYEQYLNGHGQITEHCYRLW